MLTGKSSLETAIAALRHGSFDYLTKPCKLVEIEALLRRVHEKRKLTQQYRALQRRLERIEGSPRLVGVSTGMERVRTLISKVAPTQSTVLILGETGTGKELVARAVHDQSPRAAEPFVAINCGALPETLIESELFGHRKGAFTGADEHRVGLFEVANGGTIFLDEIGELPKAMQAKLLRVLESREIRRVGENRAIDRRRPRRLRHASRSARDGRSRATSAKTSCTASTRLKSFCRRSAIGSTTFLSWPTTCSADSAARLSRQAARSPTTRSKSSSRTSGRATSASWRTCMEHATILCDEDRITAAHLPAQFNRRQLTGAAANHPGPISLRDLEMQAIYQALERHGGNKPKAADELGISLKTLYNKLNQAIDLEKSA